MLRSDLIEQVAAEFDLDEREARQVVKHFFSSIGDILEDDGRLELRGFGVFELRRREARTARNPSTGDEVEVPAREVPAFKTGKYLKQDVRSDG